MISTSSGNYKKIIAYLLIENYLYLKRYIGEKIYKQGYFISKIRKNEELIRRYVKIQEKVEKR